jgi:hypothetical protein
MANTPKFKVSFGKIAETILCQDAIGTMRFIFDVSSADGQGKPKWHLDPRSFVLEGGTFKLPLATDEDRARAALEEIKDWLASKGYSVQVD